MSGGRELPGFIPPLPLRRSFRLGTREGDYQVDILPDDANLHDTAERIERPDMIYVVLQDSVTGAYYARDVEAPLGKLVRCFAIL